GVPVSTRLWQGAPWRPRARKREDSFKAQPLAESRGATSARLHRGQDGGHLRPGRVGQQQTSRHQVSSRMYRMHGREKTSPGIMNSSTRPNILARVSAASGAPHRSCILLWHATLWVIQRGCLTGFAWGSRYECGGPGVCVGEVVGVPGT